MSTNYTQGVFRNLYIDQLNQDLNSSSSNLAASLIGLRDEAKQQNSLLIERPEFIPEAVWNRLDDLQKARTILKSWIRDLKKSKIELAEEDYLRLALDKNVPDEAARVALTLLEFTYYNKKNPAIVQLTDYIVDQVKSGRPLRFSISQCISKATRIRANKLDYFMNEDCSMRTVEQFTDGLEAKGWNEIKAITRSLCYPVEIEFLLADMDLLTIDGCQRWCTAESLDRLQYELAALKESVAIKVQDFFADVPVPIVVRSWSEFYTYDDYLEALKIASDPSNWPDRSIIKASQDLYDYYYGSYRGKVDDVALDRFTFGDIVRTAAQYRLESNIILTRNRIQAWAEHVPSPTWPIQISNYNQKQQAPSVILLKA